LKNKWLLAAIAWISICAVAGGWVFYEEFLRFEDILLLFGLFGIAPVGLVWAIRKIIAWLPRRALIASIAAIAAVWLGYWAFIELEPLRHESVSFETPPACAHSDSKGPTRNSIVSEWADGTLTVRTSVCINCAGRIRDVTAQVLGGRVFLKPRIALGEARAACDCERELIVRLGNLPKRDYQILGIPSYTHCM